MIAVLSPGQTWGVIIVLAIVAGLVGLYIGGSIRLDTLERWDRDRRASFDAVNRYAPPGGSVTFNTDPVIPVRSRPRVYDWAEGNDFG